MEAPPPALLLFARAPREGFVKTRLVPALGTAGAARLYGAFLADAARAYGPPCPWAPVLCADADPADPPFPALFPPPWRIERQAEGDLGTRLAAAFEQEFRRGAAAAVAIGADHPALPRRRVREVFDRLADGRGACVIPASDGGYCAIGLSRSVSVREVFRDVPWSTRDVLATTLARLAGAGSDLALLSASYDVDRPEDLRRLAADMAAQDPSDPDYPAATAAALAALSPGGAA